MMKAKLTHPLRDTQLDATGLGFDLTDVGPSWKFDGDIMQEESDDGDENDIDEITAIALDFHDHFDYGKGSGNHLIWAFLGRFDAWGPNMWARGLLWSTMGPIWELTRPKP